MENGMAIKDKVIMISGASRGIGKAIATKLLMEGYRVSLGARNPEQVQSDFPSYDSLLVHPYDATSNDDATAWVKATQEWYGRIDGLINCAGLLKVFQLEDEDESALDEMFDVNVKGPLRLTRAAFPYLKQSGDGRVINIISMSGKRVKGLSAGYAMRKFAQMALSQATRNTGWEHGIRTTAICPSWVNTDMAAAVCKLSPEQMTQPQDIADIVAMLLTLPNNAVVGEIALNCQLEA
jgi:NADP-dependent 3-hydroxy acid dehydrogenase YdfG